MFHRRLILLLLGFFAAFLVLTARLAKLQLADADHWQEEMRKFIHRPYPTDTNRGTILDRNGIVLARDVPCDELAIDYRAMNLDDHWLQEIALQRIKAAGEHLARGAAGQKRVAEVMQEIAGQIDAIPDAISRICGISLNEVQTRFDRIRSRIRLLRQDQWSRAYDRQVAKGQTPDAGEIDAEFQDSHLKEEVIAHAVVSPLPPEAANYFRQHADEFPGLIVRDNANRRDYPFGAMAVHVIGTVGAADQAHLDADPFRLPNLMDVADMGNLAGYLPGDRMGENGAERAAEETLRGMRGMGISDRGDETAEGAPAAGGEVRPPIERTAGGDIRLTLDMALQKDLYEALQDPNRHLLQGKDGADHFGAIVVMTMDGEILAMLSWPPYDPNTLDANRVALNRDGYRTPLLNRATLGQYQPGSTIKPIVASMGLMERVITPEETINCIGRLYPNQLEAFRCDGVHGPTSLVRAISESCDVYFYTVGSRLGLERMSRWFIQYGFGQASGLELGEAPGSVPDPLRKREADAANREAIFMGIGQGPISVTPLQMANGYATLLRGGMMIPPHIFAGTAVPPARTVSISPEYLALIRKGMEDVVTSGTAKGAFSGMRLPVAGKTGTAEKTRPVFDENGIPVFDETRPLLNPDNTPKLGPDGKPMYAQASRKDDDAWFVGYAPADKPKVIVASILEWGGHGGEKAAPMVREAFTLLEKHGYLPAVDLR